MGDFRIVPMKVQLPKKNSSDRSVKGYQIGQEDVLFPAIFWFFALMPSLLVYFLSDYIWLYDNGSE